VVRAGVTFAAFLALLLAASVQATLAPNVRGTVIGVDGAAVNCFPDEPCDPPMRMFATYVTFSRVGHPTVRARVVDGSFAIHLVPAVYTLAMSPPPGGDITPARVRVPRTGIVRLHVAVQPTP